VTRHIEQRLEKQDILAFVVNAKDPVTGTIFDFEELQLNAQTLLCDLIVSNADLVPRPQIRRRVLWPMRFSFC
jgi:hypothetical protein